MLALRATRAKDNPFDGGVEGDPRPGLKKLIDKAVLNFIRDLLEEIKNLVDRFEQILFVDVSTLTDAFGICAAI